MSANASMCRSGPCTEKAAVGEQCALDSACKSNNCSEFSGVCRQPLGANCTTSNCDLCITSANSTYCSRHCGSNGECLSGKCVGSGGDYYCHIPCSGIGDSGCPGKCRYTSGDTPVLFCDCTSPDSKMCAPLRAGKPTASPVWPTGSAYRAPANPDLSRTRTTGRPVHDSCGLLGRHLLHRGRASEHLRPELRLAIGSRKFRSRRPHLFCAQRLHSP